MQICMIMYDGLKVMMVYDGFCMVVWWYGCDGMMVRQCNSRIVG